MLCSCVDEVTASGSLFAVSLFAVLLIVDFFFGFGCGSFFGLCGAGFGDAGFLFGGDEFGFGLLWRRRGRR